MTLTVQYGKISRLSYRSSSLVVVQIHECAAGRSSFLTLHALFLNCVCEIFAKPQTVGDIVTAASPEPVFVFQLHLRRSSTTAELQPSYATRLRHAVNYGGRGERVNIRGFFSSWVQNENAFGGEIRIAITDNLECLSSRTLFICLLSGH